MPVNSVAQVNVSVPTDIEDNMAAVKADAMALRAKLGGMSNADRAQMWGHIGRSKVAPDFFDGKISKNDEQSFVALAGNPEVGPVDLSEGMILYMLGAAMTGID